MEAWERDLLLDGLKEEYMDDDAQGAPAGDAFDQAPDLSQYLEPRE